MKLKICFTVIFMIAIYACREKNANKDDIGEVFHVNPHEAKEYVNLSEIADSIICIKLQPAPGDVMGRVSEIIIRKKYIYAKDASQNMIFVFDKMGKFVSKLDKKGGGADEYVMIGSVFIDDSEKYIELIDVGKQRKLKYVNISFELLESSPFTVINHPLCRRSSGFYYFATLNADNEINGKKTNAGLVVMDDKNNMKTLFDKNIEVNNFYFFPIGECFAQNDKDELFISNAYDNTFYRLESGKAVPVYTVDFGKYGIKNSYVGALSTKKQMEYLKNMMGLACLPILNINNSDIMSFSYHFKQKYMERKGIYHADTDFRQYIKIKDRVYHVNRIKNDLTDFPDRLHICSCYYYGICNHEVWHEDYLVDVIETSSYFDGSDVDKISVEGLGEVTSDEEIIVVLMKLKK
jgi:hypothetical protein